MLRIDRRVPDTVSTSSSGCATDISGRCSALTLPGLAIGQVDVLVHDPVPFEGDDLAETTLSDLQHTDDDDDMRVIVLVPRGHGVEPDHLLRRQKPPSGRYLAVQVFLQRLVLMVAVSQKLGVLFHHG